MSTIPKLLREWVTRQSVGRCEYCQTQMELIGMAHEIDHIIPRAKNGLTVADNLCLACSSCNGYKQAKTHGLDKETGQEVPLFHPRQQCWTDHFAWSDDGLYVVGLTPQGRVTVKALQLNHELVVVARRVWVSMGYHPPQVHK